MNLDPSQLIEAGRAIGLELAPSQVERLFTYTSLLREWNSRINLVSRKDTGRVLSYHVIDSLAASRFIPADSRVADIGTGAGLPGIPLAIARPDIKMTLVESSEKKCLFLRAAITGLDLADVRLVTGRAESAPSLQSDVVLSRLTSPIDRALKHLRHHRKSDGRLVFFKTRESAREFSRICRLLARFGLAVVQTVDVELPVSCIVRRFVVIGPI